MTDTAALLREYVESGSDSAFSEIVTRHVNLVYSAALRVTGGDPHLARDAAQIVFTDLAQKAGRLPPDVVLPGWLYRHTFFTACKLVRKEKRRQAREQEAAAMQTENQTKDGWQELAPVLDEALSRLREADRDAIVLRFLDQRSLRNVGELLGVTEDAARKRIDRALESLRKDLAGRGVALSGAGLLATLSANAVTAAPPGLATSLTAASLTAAASSPAGTLAGFIHFIGGMKIAALVAGLIFVAGLATPSISGKQSTANLTKQAPAPGAEPRNARLVSTATSPALGRLKAWLQEVRKTDPEGWRIDDELRYMVWCLDPRDFASAWGLRAEVSAGIRKKLESTLLAYWIRIDPQAALSAAGSLPEGESRRELVASLVQQWSGRDPEPAMQWIRSAPPEMRTQLLLAAARGAAATNISLALKTLDDLPDASLREHVKSGLMRQWAASNPSQAAPYLDALPPSHERGRAMMEAISTWALTDPERVLQWARKLPEGLEKSKAVQEGLISLSKRNPARTVELAREFQVTLDESPHTGYAFLESLVKTWAESDPRGAFEWVAQLPPGLHRTGAMIKLILAFQRKDPAGAAQLVLQFPEGNPRLTAMSSVLGHWVGTDQKAATEWARALPEDATRQAAFHGLCAGLARDDPEEAARFVAALAPGEMQAKLAVTVAKTWAQNHLDAAVEWVKQFPDVKLRDRATSEIVRALAISDVKSAEHIMQSLPQGTTRSATAKAFVESLSYANPSVAARWVVATGETEEQYAMIELLAGRWLPMDRDAATKWLEQTSLPMDRKEKLLK